ncbi:hypothetical protein [Bartonella harrusi]|uniref:Uncharacterized protein n=1 Tax=Bartonella harrusi TaxID=2961895 RepID=A0ABY5ES84_9HYPH|nr:hypothetical protein [Bartonella harrusi]UTO28247.1 hypothetical protein NMK50_08885 [Bartonella harrusi]
MYDTFEKELTDEHCKKVWDLLENFSYHKEYYVKTVRLMENNEIILEKFIDSRINKERIAPTVLLLHWWLYVVDDTIIDLTRQ